MQHKRPDTPPVRQPFTQPDWRSISQHLHFRPRLEPGLCVSPPTCSYWDRVPNGLKSSRAYFNDDSSCSITYAFPPRYTAVWPTRDYKETYWPVPIRGLDRTCGTSRGSCTLFLLIMQCRCLAGLKKCKELDGPAKIKCVAAVKKCLMDNKPQGTPPPFVVSLWYRSAGPISEMYIYGWTSLLCLFNFNEPLWWSKTYNFSTWLLGRFR